MFTPEVPLRMWQTLLGRLVPRSARGGLAWLAGAALAGLLVSCSDEAPPPWTEFQPGVAYTNVIVKEAPWSIHIARVDRHQANLVFHTTHARGVSIGLASLSEQVRTLPASLGQPVAAINGDYYQTRARPYFGDARGLQVADGEVLSSPIGGVSGVSFWIDSGGQPHLTNVESQFRVVWTNGEPIPFGVNEPRRPSVAVLYTPSLGLRSTSTTNGLELVLEKAGEGPWLPLRLGETITARVREVCTNANTPLEADTMVLSFSRTLTSYVPPVETGAVVNLVLETSPSLAGVRTAIGGGPALICGGKRQKWGKKPADDEEPLPYQFSSMEERHPRTALGWNDHYVYLVVVDGRQRELSAGMSLNELASYMGRKLGCTEVMNFDGGGSSTLWCNGEVRNSPCDGLERNVANSLIVVRKGEARPAPASATN